MVWFTLFLVLSFLFFTKRCSVSDSCFFSRKPPLHPKNVSWRFFHFLGLPIFFSEFSLHEATATWPRPAATTSKLERPSTRWGEFFPSKIFYFHPDPWGRWTHFDWYFSNGLKPPTRCLFYWLRDWFLDFLLHDFQSFLLSPQNSVPR